MAGIASMVDLIFLYVVFQVYIIQLYAATEI